MTSERAASGDSKGDVGAKSVSIRISDAASGRPEEGGTLLSREQRGHSSSDHEHHQVEKDTAVAVIMFSVENKNAALIKLKDWLKGIGNEVEQWKGFISREVLLPPESKCAVLQDIPVSVVLNFDTHRNLKAWSKSTERRAWLESARLQRVFDPSAVTIDYINEGDGVITVKGSGGKYHAALHPPKYRLWILIFFAVFLAVWCTVEAGTFNALQNTFGVEFEITLFIELYLVVQVLVFGGIPLLLRFRPVAMWMHSRRLVASPPKPSTPAFKRFILECWVEFVKIANDGLGLFAPPPTPPPDPRLAERIHRLEGRVRALRKENFNLKQRTSPVDVISGKEDLGESQSFAESNKELLNEMRTHASVAATKSTAGTFSVAIHHMVLWEKYDEFLQWQKSIQRAIVDFPGYVSTYRMRTDFEQDTVSEHMEVSVVLQFSDMKSLQNWMLSDARRAHVRALEPMLHKPDRFEVGSASVPDSFTSLLVEPGTAAQARPPPKWKVGFLTTVSLYLVVWPMLLHSGRVYDKWGIGADSLLRNRFYLRRQCPFKRIRCRSVCDDALWNVAQRSQIERNGPTVEGLG